MKKKLLGISLLLLLAALLCVGCAGNNKNAIYDDEKKLADQGDSFSVDSVSQTVQDRAYTATVTMTGANTVWRYQTEEESQIELSCLLSATHGKAKLVLIQPDGTLYTLVESTAASDDIPLNTTLVLPKGESRLKLVAADDAQIELRLFLDVGDYEMLGMSNNGW